jgi:hypothetical protein
MTVNVTRAVDNEGIETITTNLISTPIAVNNNNNNNPQEDSDGHDDTATVTPFNVSVLVEQQEGAEEPTAMDLDDEYPLVYTDGSNNTHVAVTASLADITPSNNNSTPYTDAPLFSSAVEREQWLWFQEYLNRTDDDLHKMAQ